MEPIVLQPPGSLFEGVISPTPNVTPSLAHSRFIQFLDLLRRAEGLLQEGRPGDIRSLKPDPRVVAPIGLWIRVQHQYERDLRAAGGSLNIPTELVTRWI